MGQSQSELRHPDSGQDKLKCQFFIIFNFWAALFCLYILIFMAVSLHKSDSVDGQMIALAAV
jgi:hypothetical protein